MADQEQPPATPPGPAVPGSAEPLAVFDPKSLLGLALELLKAPLEALQRRHVPGRRALVEGASLGGFVVLLMPLLRWLLPTGQVIAFADALRVLLFGVTWLMTAPLLSLLFRAVLGKAGRVDFCDDVYLLGSSLLFVLIGALAGGVCRIIWPQLGAAVFFCGVVLAAFAHAAGLISVGGVVASRALWFTLALFGYAMLVWL